MTMPLIDVEQIDFPFVTGILKLIRNYHHTSDTAHLDDIADRLINYGARPSTPATDTTLVAAVDVVTGSTLNYPAMARALRLTTTPDGGTQQQPHARVHAQVRAFNTQTQMAQAA